MDRRLLVAIVLGACGAAACASNSSATSTATTPTSPSGGPPTVLTFTAAGSLTLGTGDSRQLKAVALLSDGTIKIFTSDATWTSSNSSVVTVTDSGIATGVSAGVASITIGVSGTTVTGTITVTVGAPTTDVQTFIGTVSGANGLSGTLEITVLASSHAEGALYIGASAVSLIGRFDAAASVINVLGGDFSLLGTLSNSVVIGTFTRADGSVGGFSAVDATHTAVTTFCGTYTGGDGTTGALDMALSTTGSAAGSSMQSDGNAPPLLFVGRVNAGSLTMATASGLAANGTIQNGTAAGTFQVSPVSAGSFSAMSSACR